MVQDNSFFGCYFNSSISGVIFTPKKGFLKRFFGVKITPQNITPLLGVKFTPLEELLQLLENYCETSYVDSPELGNILKDKKDKLTSDNEKRKLKKKKNDGLVDHMKVNLIIYDSLRKSRALGQKYGEKYRIPCD